MYQQHINKKLTGLLITVLKNTGVKKWEKME